MKNKSQISQLVAQSVDNSQKIPWLPILWTEIINISNFTTPVQSISNLSTEVFDRRMMQKISNDIPFYPDEVYRPCAKPVKIPMPQFPGKMDINPELYTDMMENSLFQEGVIWETYQRADK